MVCRGRGWIYGAHEAHFQIDCQPRYISIRCFADGRVTNARVASSNINVTSKLRTIMPLAIHRSVFCRISSNGSNLSMVVAQSWSNFHLRNKKKEGIVWKYLLQKWRKVKKKIGIINLHKLWTSKIISFWIKIIK